MKIYQKMLIIHKIYKVNNNKKFNNLYNNNKNKSKKNKIKKFKIFKKIIKITKKNSNYYQIIMINKNKI